MTKEQTPKNNHHTEKYKHHLYLLSFIDTADRLDILMLEIRHLQQTIIHVLRMPTLYLPLRYEEKYIFGEWCNLLTNAEKADSPLLGDLRRVNRAIIRYPLPRTTIKQNHQGGKQRPKDHDKHQQENIKIPDDHDEHHQENIKNSDDDYHLWKKDWEEITAALEKRIDAIWSGDSWARGQRRYYFALIALQVLKQQIFRDKLTLFRRGRRFNLLSTEKSRHKPAFMVLRRGIMKRIEGYIASLKTHKQQLEKSLGFGLQDFPRPDVDRRREVGIFQDFLSTRTVDVQQDMIHLLGTLTSTKINPDDQRNLTASQTPLILHGWSQANVMSSSQLYDRVNRDSNIWRRSTDDQDSTEVKNRGFPIQHVMYMDTSFWSPDRPDLQPLIAKELAFALHRDQLDNFSAIYVGDNPNPFTDLYVNLYQIINNFCDTDSSTKRHPETLEVIGKGMPLFLRILFDDFLAASVKGIAYLHALFLSLVGQGLHKLLDVGKELKLEIVDELPSGGSTRGIHAYRAEFMWYFRLRLVAFWLEKVMHVPMNRIDLTVVQGSREICDELVDFIDSGLAHEQKAGVLWQELALKLEHELECHQVTDIVKNWRDKRSRDSWDEDWKTPKEMKDPKPGVKHYRRSTMRLDIRLQNYLFRRLLDEKSGEDGILHNWRPKDSHDLSAFKQFIAQLEEIYLFDQTEPNAGAKKVQPERIPHHSNNKELYHSRWLFRHLYDIPFQSCIMRSIDLLSGKGQQKSWDEFCLITHKNMTMGREIFSLALEFYTWGRESTKSRLLLCINLIQFILAESETESDKEIKKRLDKWLGKPDDDIEDFINSLTRTFPPAKKLFLNLRKYTLKKSDDNQDQRETVNNKTPQGKAYKELVEQLADISRKDVRELHLKHQLMHHIGAQSLHALFAYIEENSSKRERRLEQLSGYKLQGLYQLLTSWIQDQQVSNYEQGILTKKLTSLAAFLSIHDSQKDQGQPQLAEDDFYTQLLPAFGDETGIASDGELTISDLPPRIERVLVSRLSFSNYYPVMDYGTPIKNPNGLSLSESLLECTDKNNKGISTVLGQYDAISLRAIRLACRCEMSYIGEKQENGELINEKFPSHFSRREIAIPVDIHDAELPKEIDKNHKNEPIYSGPINESFFAITTLSLQRREMRLNLIYRLLKVVKAYSKIQSNQHTPLGLVEQSFSNLLLNHGDRIRILGLLTDGWGDFLLLFYPIPPYEGSVELLRDILDLQQVFYEDFMVDRSELVLTPTVLDCIQGEKDFQVQINSRLLEDRRLETTFGNHHADLFNNPDFENFITPGRMDFLLVPKKGFPNEQSNRSYYQQIIDSLSTHSTDKGRTSESQVNSNFKDAMSMLDKIETRILYQPEDSKYQDN